MKPAAPASRSLQRVRLAWESSERSLLVPLLPHSSRSSSCFVKTRPGSVASSASLLVTVASSVIAIGILFVIGAWLAGATAPATSLRSQASPYLRESRGATYGVAAAVFLGLIAWAPILAFRKPLGILIFAALFAAGTELLRRQTLVEFPDTQPGEASSRLRSFASSLAGRQPAAAGAQGQPPGAVGDDPLARLERLSALRREGALTDAEFEAQKQKLL